MSVEWSWFLASDKHESFQQVGSTTFGGSGQVCPYSQSNCIILGGALFHKGLDRLPCFYVDKDLYQIC